MKIINSQSGIGLVEVLVSLLLLAVAVLGFTSLQMNSVRATDESMKRTQAMSVIRHLSENIRTNVAAAPAYKQVIDDANAAGSSFDPDTATVSITGRVSADPVVEITKTIDLDSCQGLVTPPSDPCIADHVAARDALQSLSEAKELEVSLGMEVCPGTQAVSRSGGGTLSYTDSDISRYCIIASWDGTEPVMSADPEACADADGGYNTDAHCIIVGAY